MQDSSSIKTISVSDLKTKLDQKQSIEIIDVRELNEYQFCNIGGKHIPLGELPLRLDDLDKNQTIAVLCRSGGRSATATLFLDKAGFTSVYNIVGGIIAWSQEIDSTVPIY